MIKNTTNAKLAARKLIPLAKGALTGIAALILLTMLSAVCYNLAEAPEGTDVILAYISLGCAALVGGMFCAAANGKNGLIWGSFAGVEMFAVCCVGAVITGNISGGEAVSKLLLCIIAAAVGGVIGVNKAARR